MGDAASYLIDGGADGGGGGGGGGVDTSGLTTSVDGSPVYDVGAVFTTDATATADPTPAPSLDQLFSMPFVTDPTATPFTLPTDTSGNPIDPTTGQPIVTDTSGLPLVFQPDPTTLVPPVPNPAAPRATGSPGGAPAGAGGGVGVGGSKPPQTPGQQTLPKQAPGSSLPAGLSFPLILLVGLGAYLAFKKRRAS